jgi:hypothetical protein
MRSRQPILSLSATPVADRLRKASDMHNQHAGLSQALSEQRIAERRQQAAHARLLGGARPARRRRRAWMPRRWWQLVWRSAVAAEQPAHRPHRAS